MTVDINPIQRHPIRPFTHVGQKRGKAALAAPSGANRDASSAISVVAGRLWVFAAKMHGLPSVVGRRPAIDRMAVLAVSLPQCTAPIHLGAAATLGLAREQLADGEILSRPAVAGACHPPQSTDTEYIRQH